MSDFKRAGTVYGEPEKAAILEPDTIFAKHYKIVRKIGEGGMGMVYEAYDDTARENIALKLLHPALFADGKALDKLRDEVTLARKIRHPNVVAVHDVQQHEGQAFQKMELLSGRTLREFCNAVINAKQKVPVEAAASIPSTCRPGRRRTDRDWSCRRPARLPRSGVRRPLPIVRADS